VVEAAPTPVPPAPVATALPVVAGNPAVGRTLTATPGAWDQNGLTYAYQWLRDGVPVPGATSSKLVLGAADVGHRMAVQVTASRAGAAPGVARSAETRPVTKAPSRVTLQLADATPAPDERTKLTVRVASDPLALGASGRIVVRVDGKVVRRVRLDHEKAALRLAFATGKHILTVSYAGSASVAPSSEKLRVRPRS
jgi:hypothetical protein